MKFPAIALICCGFASLANAGEPPFKPEDVRFFENRIRPLLAENCFGCHGAQKQKSDLRLDSAEGFRRGGSSGTMLIDAGNPAGSLLLKLLEHADADKRMPPKGRLTDRQIADVKLWVKTGAAYPSNVPPAGESRHWAFQKPALQTPPTVRDAAWVRSPIDAFVLAKLEAKNLRPAAPADPRTLIRRSTFDLTGLPPTPEEVENFLRESAGNPKLAYENLINRLLASPAYGERWARHWLDVARYADSNGLDENVAFGTAWRYRDYVVNALNKDKPYDQFLREQLAGDLLQSPDQSTRNERLIATGFLNLGPKILAEVDAKKMEMDIIDEQIDTVGRSVLGLTLGCARCHNHKFDPVTIDDYYGLAGIFQSTKSMENFIKLARWYENPLASPEEIARKAEADKKIAALREAIKKIKDPAELKKKNDEVAALEKAHPELPTALGVTEGTAANTKVLLRGNHLTPGKITPRQFPVALAGDRQKSLPEKESGRLALADWLTQKDHPLTARVMVNRVWRWHFGQGLVRSTDNFGLIGEKPSHPEMLDWLANRFVESGWSIKNLHREIMLSSTYQTGGAGNTSLLEADAENRLLGRTNVRRLEGEAIRDSLLAVSGQLDRSLGGPALQHVKNRDYLFDHTSKDLTTYDSKRRSIYLPVIRNNIYDVFQLFDATDATVINGDRSTTTVATQALFMMNGPMMVESAGKLTARLLEDKSLDDPARIRKLYLTCYGRQPSERESERARSAITGLEQELASSEPDAGKRRGRAWASFGHVLLAANEFVYVN